jgi:hypothetical protein
MILGVLQGEANWQTAVEENHKGIVSTSAPDGLLKLYFEAF